MKILLSFLLLFYAICPMAEAQELTVGSYNIRYQNKEDNKRGNGWAQRCQSVCNQILWERPDVFGAQEVLYPQLVDLEVGLPSYHWIGVGRDDGKQKGEYAAIFYNPQRVELLDKGHFWLNETPDRPALGWDAACVRICTWGHFRDRLSGQDFYFINLHMDHVGVVARSESAKLVMQRITEMTEGGRKLAVLTGDFNVSQENDLYRLFTDTGVLKDCYTAATMRFAENGTFNGFMPDRYTTDRIDHIFVTPATIVDAYAVLTNGRWQQEEDGRMQQRLLSDHYPVFARIRFTLPVATEQEAVNLVFIGNSITAGATLENRAEQAPPIVCTKLVQKTTGMPTHVYNGGHSGLTTYGFLPGRADFEKACRAAEGLLRENGGMLLFSIMLGTNDSASTCTEGAPVSAETYEVNMQSIIEELIRRFPTCRIVLNYPIWYSSNTHNSAQYLQEGLDRLHGYYPAIDRIVKTYPQVYAGNRKAWKAMKGKTKFFTPEQGRSGTFYLHPNVQGAERLARVWSKGILKVIKKDKTKNSEL